MNDSLSIFQVGSQPNQVSPHKLFLPLLATYFGPTDAHGHMSHSCYVAMHKHQVTSTCNIETIADAYFMINLLQLWWAFLFFLYFA